jgi:hypothetical protein
MQRCWDGPTMMRYYPDGGPTNNGMYDIDPKSKIARYFDILKMEPGDVSDGPTKKELIAELEALGIKTTPVMNKATLTEMLAQAKEPKE